MRIENLWQFRNLEKLQLDNNIIEKIEGLDTLVHLEWLGRMLEPSLSPLTHRPLTFPTHHSPQTYHSITLRRWLVWTSWST